MVFTDASWRRFSLIPHRVRAAMAEADSAAPFKYKGEDFFKAYEALGKCWAKRQSMRKVSNRSRIQRSKLRLWEQRFISEGTLGLLCEVSAVEVDEKLERLVVLVKTARPHENASLSLKLADALEIPGGSLALIRRIQRSHGYGQNLDQADCKYFQGLQHILRSAMHLREDAVVRDKRYKARSFFDFEHDPLQQRVELFKALSTCKGRRQVRPVLRQFAVHSNRFYVLKERYMTYGVWGLVDLVQTTKIGEKISPEMELQIIEQRLMDPSLSTVRMIEKLGLKCSKSNVQKIYHRWGLSRFKRPVVLRGVLAASIPAQIPATGAKIPLSAKRRFPNLITTAALKLHPCFERLLGVLRYRHVVISNPGALIVAPFLAQFGVVEALHTYGPPSLRSSRITNNIIVNVLRIIAGFPTIGDFSFNCDRSVAIAAGLSLNPTKSRFYDSFDQLRFEHLQKLRNDTACRARELGIIECEEIAVDYHCDPCDSRFARERSLSKAPDKNGDMVYAHRPQILWDSLANSIINIAYCEGRSRAPSALYRFCEQNLFKVIDPQAVREIYADSEYTGEKQLVYLSIRSKADVTMCLKQNPKIRRWKEQTVQDAQWSPYGTDYKIATRDFILAQTGKPFRFIVKQNNLTDETRCFGSTHADYSPQRILDAYHIRWPVETGIKDLIENYFLNKPTGVSPEKVETHYYCVMLARLTVDYFRSLLCVPQWHSPEQWECVLSTIRTSIFSSQNCQLRLNDAGDFVLTYLDGDKHGIKRRLAKLLLQGKNDGFNAVSWWGNRGVQIEVTDQFDF